ncbi:hypothetical protein [Hallerella succinigenes]|uniref:hypothetical protein n=1 Tax=Hallerella succinigenes TaxID=1896222 RepID=UPI002A833F70|nr:hypothetical protein [Hallerella succinigenes]
MPSFLVNWHHKQFAISGGFFIIGGGGEAKFNDGLPMIDQFISGIRALPNGKSGNRH